MINKIDKIPFHTYASSVYDYNELSLQELLNKFFVKINECVDLSNTALEFLEWLKGEGLPLEVVKEIELMYLDGRLATIINETIFSELNQKINLNTEGLIKTKQDILTTNEKIELLETNTMNYIDSIMDSKINLKLFALQNKIDTSTSWRTAFVQALQYCRLNGRTLYIPTGTYHIGEQIHISGVGESKVNIVGENMTDTILTFDNDGFKFTSVDKVIEYQKRFTFITIKNLTVKNKTNTLPLKGTGLNFEYFGYVLLDSVRIRNFNIGLKLYNGSEFDGYTLQILGNTLGVHMEKPTLENGSDLANINFSNCRLHNNNDLLKCINGREITFDKCCLMDYTGTSYYNGTVNNVNYINCDFENQEGSTNLTLDCTGRVNIINSVFANSHGKKIIVKPNKNVYLNLINCNLDNTVTKVIYFEYPFIGTFKDDRGIKNIFFEGPTEILNYERKTLLNEFNHDFSKQSVIPYGVNATNTFDTTDFITGNCSLSFEANTSEKYISYNMSYVSGTPTEVEVIFKGNPSNNVVRLVYTDGTTGYNYALGGADILVQELANGFKKVISTLPKEKPGNPIKAIQILMRNNTEKPKIDCVRIMGIGGEGGNRPTWTVQPTSGKFEVGDTIYNRTPTIQTDSTLSKSYFIEGWKCVASPNTFVPMRIYTT